MAGGDVGAGEHLLLVLHRAGTGEHTQRAVADGGVADAHDRALRAQLPERYLDGAEYSVETFSFNGRHVVVAVTEKWVDPRSFAEIGHVVPARIDPADEERIRAAVPRFLTTMGLRDGVAHTEVRLGAHGVGVIESHNRVAGDAIPDLVEGAYGIDLITYSIGWPFGLVPELPDRPAPHAGASTRFVVGTPGRVVSVAGVREAAAAPEALVVRAIDVRVEGEDGTVVRAGAAEVAEVVPA